MRKYIQFSVLIILVASLMSCSNKRERQYQYMPDMYVAVPFETDGVKGLSDISSNLEPVTNTIARGQVPYEYDNTNDDYEKAKSELKSPLKTDEINLEKGKKLYGIYCATCHGNKGDGNGVLAQREKFAGIPNYKDRDINEGSIYHVIMHGKNLMGSHASQLTYQERWQVVQYVEKLRNDLLK